MHTTITAHPALLPALEDAVRSYDRATSLHSARVGHFAGIVGSALGLRDEELTALCWSGFIHDLGKLAIDQEVLGRPGPLTADERREVQRHTVVGAEILLSISSRLAPIAEGVRSHHEWWDGTGYPDARAGDAIPRSGRIVAVADVFDSVTHPRSYRKHVYTHDEATALIESEAGAHFDPAVVKAFVDLYEQGLMVASDHTRTR
jgi:putative two-component system response regulator